MLMYRYISGGYKFVYKNAASMKFPLNFLGLDQHIYSGWNAGI